jgi:hypothetical protein
MRRTKIERELDRELAARRDLSNDYLALKAKFDALSRLYVDKVLEKVLEAEQDSEAD